MGPQVLRDDRCRHHRPEGQVRILPSSHPQVHLCQLQGRCCQGCRPPSHGSEERSCCRQLEDGQSLRKGSWLLQAGREGQGSQETQGQEARRQEGCQEACCQEGQEARCQEACCQEASCQEASKEGCQEVNLK